MSNRIRRGLSLALALLAAGLSTGCSKDEEVLAFVSELDAFSSTIVERVKSAPDLPTGLDAAQQYLDGNKEALRAKLAAVKEVKNFQLSDETKKKVEDSFARNAKAVAGLPLDYVGQLALNPGLQARFEKLINDYRDVITK